METTKKSSWVSIDFTFKLKDIPESYKGLISENCKIAANKPLSLFAMIVGIAIRLSEFYGVTMDMSIGQVNEQLETAAEHISNLLKHHYVEGEVFDAIQEMNECRVRGSCKYNDGRKYGHPLHLNNILQKEAGNQ